MKINQMKKVQVEAKVLSIHMKVCDGFCAGLLDADWEVIKDYEGYVPEFMPGDKDGGSHYGDYLILDIDIDTGQILNWKKPTQEQIESFINGKEQ